MTKSKNKTRKKAISNKKKKTKIKLKDAFVLHPCSPMEICDIERAVNNLSYAQKSGGYIIESVHIGTDPIKIAVAFENIKLKAKADNRLFVFKKNAKTKTICISSVEGSDNSNLPISYLKTMISNWDIQQKKAIRDIKNLKGDDMVVDAVERAYNQAIISLEEFLVKTGHLEFEEKECKCMLHPFIPTNSIVDICDECSDDFTLDELQAKKDAKEREMENQAV